jgi:hypothetical protein
MLRATLMLLLLTGCAIQPAPDRLSAPQNLSTAQICKNETMAAMRSGQADNTSGALYERCIAERESPRPAELSPAN